MAKMGSSIYPCKQSKDESSKPLECDYCKIEMKQLNQFNRCPKCAKVVVDEGYFENKKLEKEKSKPELKESLLSSYSLRSGDTSKKRSEPEVIELTDSDEEIDLKPVKNMDRKMANETNDSKPIKIENKSEFVYSEWQIRTGDIESMEKMLRREVNEDMSNNLSCSEIPFKARGKYLRIGAYQNETKNLEEKDPDKVSSIEFTEKEGIQINFIESQNKINITISTSDVKYCACIFYEPMYLILMHIDQNAVDMYQKSMKFLDGFESGYPSGYSACNRLVYILNIQKSKLKDFSNMLSSYFSTIIPENCVQLNFIKQQKAKELVYYTFRHCKNVPEIVENFVKGFVPITSKILLKYPLNEQSKCSTIEINSVDYSCLKEGEFLNDNIISFYLKYLFNEILSSDDRRRTHIFDTFFYQKLTHSTETKSKEDNNLSAAQRRYMRVKNWTRNVNIFEKDFLIIPINKNAHWYLAIVCYPYLKEPIYQENSKIKSEREKKKEPFKFKLLKQSNECEFIPDDLSSNDEAEAEDSKDGFVEDERICLKRPIILIFDSLPATNQNKRVIATIRQYLECEWNSKHPNEEQESKFLTKMIGTNVDVPLQTNYFDCGIYLLQYVENFFTKPIEKFNLPINLETWFHLSAIKTKRSLIKELIIKLRNSQKNIENSVLFQEKKSELSEKQANSKKSRQSESDDEIPSKKVTKTTNDNDKLNLNVNSLKDKHRNETKLVKNGQKILSDLELF